MFFGELVRSRVIAILDNHDEIRARLEPCQGRRVLHRLRHAEPLHRRERRAEGGVPGDVHQVRPEHADQALHGDLFALRNR